MKPVRVCCGYPMEHRKRYYPESGVTQGRVQCHKCGNSYGEAVKVTPDMPRFETERYEEYIAKKYPPITAQKLDQMMAYKIAAAERKEEYAQYLRSPHWIRISSQAMARDGFRCQVCEAPATEVHHITYNHRGDEYLWELVSLCRGCHQDQHR